MRLPITPRLALLAAAHFSIDSYSSFLTPLLPLLVAKLGLNLTAVGALVACASISSSLSQPLFGLLADRMRRPWFVAFGPLVAATFLGAVGSASSFASLATLVVLGGIGVAAFHPQAAALATVSAPRRGLALSVFVTGGTLGFSFGPLFAVAVVGVFGLARTSLASLPGIAMSIVLLVWFVRNASRPHAHVPRAPLAELRPFARPLALLYFAVVFRSAVGYGFMTFLPIYLTRRGFTVQQGGAALAAYLAGGALGAFVGGWMADRIGGRRVVIHSFLGAIPMYAAFLLLPPLPGLACLVVGGFMLQGSLPVNVVMGQELSPAHASTISSLLMGAGWGIGVLLVGPTGALADARGLPVALGALATLLLVGLCCAIALPDVRGRVTVPEMAGPPAPVA